MASWVKCKCDALVHTNMFAGENVSAIVSDAFLDELPDKLSGEDLQSRTIALTPRLYRCKECSRVLIEHKSGRIEFFAFEPT